jgi:hypothetical protein
MGQDQPGRYLQYLTKEGAGGKPRPALLEAAYARGYPGRALAICS